MRMPTIAGILFDPVGCLAEFPSEPFEAIASQVLGHTLPAGTSGSQAYWELLGLLDDELSTLTMEQRARVEEHELRAVEQALPYEDTAPALAALGGLGISLIAASSLSDVALRRFLDTSSLDRAFGAVWSRDTAGGVKHAPIEKALTAQSLAADGVLFLTDTAAGLQAGRAAGVNAILMMNDPDEAMKLTSCNPAGGIVSLLELPDFVRFVAAENACPAGAPTGARTDPDPRARRRRRC
jgi:phosphoglycolate phosphatase-like HAD superfamily hydrolase